MSAKPYIVGLGGTLRPDSSTEKAVAVALRAAAEAGAETLLLGGADLDLPLYAPHSAGRTAAAARLVAELRRADGVILATPGYHGAMSGLMKNAIDYVEDMSGDLRPYLEGRAVGCIVTAAGWQATATTLVGLRGVVHALRGWPTPLGVTINTAEPVFDEAGSCQDGRVSQQLDLLARQVVEFAGRWRAAG
ncbi:FMN reductase [Caulobacter sp. CCUG 60055]|uniref:NADPH-dependent FMN reductase n=1 Tax=Caulobacter sp. CCUG 60055 TaxID=2100090 RepID=UPI001FA6DDEF|nr:NAD(P)H-dependent oxidoreductase [Caulobacter sp. CCUG 60055]MBQ1540812.1 NAD(P)H-dependent oxidoreductase [Caulobacteraceae bacterium]MCI3179318.1 FMN reductase [Caulobacter sp. CCUG 60055]